MQFRDINTNSRLLMTNNIQINLEGWKNRGTFDEPRLSDVVEMYEEMDFEVMLVDFDPDAHIGCVECMKIEPHRYKIVYTRKLG